LLARLRGADVVVGYRYQRADHWVRKMNAGAWNWLIRTLLGVRIQDLDCAFKLFRREVVEGLRLTAEGAGINAEIMAQCTHGGLRIEETPVTHYPRYYGAPTGAAVRVIMKAFRELPRLWRYRYAAPILIAPRVNLSHDTVLNGDSSAVITANGTSATDLESAVHNGSTLIKHVAVASLPE
jgi:hypothetical protein